MCGMWCAFLYATISRPVIRWLTEIGDTDVIVLNRIVLISGWPELVYKGNYKDTSLLISTTKQPEELSQILIKYIYRTDFL